MTAATRKAWEWVSKKLTFGRDTQYKNIYKIKALFQENEPKVYIHTDGDDDNSWFPSALTDNDNDADVNTFSYKLQAGQKKHKSLYVKLVGDQATDGTPSSSQAEVESLGVVYKLRSVK